MGRGGVACPKPETRKRTKARKKRQALTNAHEIHDYAFARERAICRCCRCRAAHSSHELLFRSLGGKRSRRNTVAVCGSGTTLCHGFLQRNEIAWEPSDPALGAESSLMFTPKTESAATHMRLKLGESIVSPPMRESEFDAREMA